MSEVTVLPAEARTRNGKGPARRLRMTGRVPAIVYGGNDEPLMISLPIKEMKRQLGTNPRFFSQLFTLDIDGRKLSVLPREAQLHPVTDDPLHVDFIRATEGARVVVEVPVVFRNEAASPGLKKGGVLNIVRREIELSCPIDRIPAELEVDLTGLEIHDTVHISAVTLPDGVRPTIERNFTICSVAPPLTGGAAEDEEAAATTTAAAGTTPAAS
jgi:large subunit ribosomal protein L25